MKVIMNPNKVHADEMLKQLRLNGGFCPCALKKTDDTKCKCKEFRDQVEKGIEGMCHCELYIAIKD